ncbi:MAG: hypothetical protein LBE30_13080 [Comamonas sp.]|jgi:hypothetical protein|nr:hypothetical protein [Comamonas sp.]
MPLNAQTVDSRLLLLSLQRALLGAVHPQLRQASIEADAACQLLRLRFEYDGLPCEDAREGGSIATTEVLADLQGPWSVNEEHLAAPYPQALQALAHIAYRRREA